MYNWFQQADTTMAMWMQAQKQMMDNWQQMMQMAMPGMANNPMASVAAQQMMSTQAMSLRLYEMMSQSWENMQGGMNDPAAWQAEMERVRSEVMAAMTGGMQPSADNTELWNVYMEQMQTFMMPWVQAATESAEYMTGMMQGDASAYIKASELYFNAYESTLGSMMQAPGLGLNREMDEKMRAGFAAWMNVQEANYAYQVMLANGWTNAYREMMEQMMAAPGANDFPTTMRAFIDRWSVTADEVFKDIFRSNEFVEAQGNYVNAMMAFKLKQRDISEAYLRYTDMPTRSEIDEAHKRIYEMGKELKALRREMAEMKEATAPKKRKSAPRKKKTATTPDEEQA